MGKYLPAILLVFCLSWRGKFNFKSCFLVQVSLEPVVPILISKRFYTIFHLLVMIYFAVYVHPCLISVGSGQFYLYDTFFFQSGFQISFAVHCLLCIVTWEYFSRNAKSFIIYLLIFLAISLLSIPNQPTVKLFRKAIDTLAESFCLAAWFVLFLQLYCYGYRVFTSCTWYVHLD